MDTNSYIQLAELDEIGLDEMDLLASVGLNAELVFEGPGGYCPHCAALPLSDAA
jgi:hypothetical protein